MGMTEPVQRKIGLPSVLLAVVIFVSPLVQGGTPRLGTLLIELCFAALVGVAVTRRGGASLIPAPPDQVEAALYLFFLLAALNLPRVDYYHDAERCFLFILTYVGTYSFMARLPGDRPLAPVLAAVKGTAVFQAALALGQVFFVGRYQPQGTFDNPNFLAGFLVAGASLLLADLLRLPGAGTLRRLTALPARLLPTGGLLLLLAALVWTRSRGGMLALATAFILLLVARFGRRALVPVFLAVPLALFLLLTVPNPFRQRIVSLSSQDVYAYSRLSMWKSGLAMFRDHPLLGVGLGQYQFFSPRYAFPVEGYWARYAKVADNPHSEPVMLAAELGLAGILVLVLFLAAVVRGLRTRQGVPGTPRRRPHWPLLILLGLAVQGSVDFTFHSPPVVLAALALLAAWVTGGREETPHPGRLPLRPGFLRLAAVLLLPVYVILAVRPVVAFSWYLKAGGAPVDLLDEKGALAHWGEGISPDRRLLERTLFWDGMSAPYHSALGSSAVKAFSATRDRRWLERAFREIAAAIALNPNNHRYREHLADLEASLYQAGLADPQGLAEARQHLGEAVMIAPADVFLREKAGRLSLRAGDAEAAREQFERATRLEPCFLRAWAGLGQSLEALGRVAEAGSLRRDLEARSAACRNNPVNSPYERSLIDEGRAAVHNRSDVPEGADGGPEKGTDGR